MHTEIQTATQLCLKNLCNLSLKLCIQLDDVAIIKIMIMIVISTIIGYYVTNITGRGVFINLKRGVPRRGYISGEHFRKC